MSDVTKEVQIRLTAKDAASGIVQQAAQKMQKDLGNLNTGLQLSGIAYGLKHLKNLTAELNNTSASLDGIVRKIPLLGDSYSIVRDIREFITNDEAEERARLATLEQLNAALVRQRQSYLDIIDASKMHTRELQRQAAMFGSSPGAAASMRGQFALQDFDAETAKMLREHQVTATATIEAARTALQQEIAKAVEETGVGSGAGVQAAGQRLEQLEAVQRAGELVRIQKLRAAERVEIERAAAREIAEIDRKAAEDRAKAAAEAREKFVEGQRAALADFARVTADASFAARQTMLRSTGQDAAADTEAVRRRANDDEMRVFMQGLATNTDSTAARDAIRSLEKEQLDAIRRSLQPQVASVIQQAQNMFGLFGIGTPDRVRDDDDSGSSGYSEPQAAKNAALREARFLTGVGARNPVAENTANTVKELKRNHDAIKALATAISQGAKPFLN